MPPSAGSNPVGVIDLVFIGSVCKRQSKRTVNPSSHKRSRRFESCPAHFIRPISNLISPNASATDYKLIDLSEYLPRFVDPLIVSYHRGPFEMGLTRSLPTRHLESCPALFATGMP